MTRNHIGDYDLWNRVSRKLETASLFGDIVENNTRDFVDLWKAEFDTKRAALKESGDFTPEGLSAAGLQDAHWDWPKKAGLVDEATLIGYSVECAGRTQGLMLVMPYGFAREASQIGLPLTQVGLISSAPWNRPLFTDAPVYKGVGQILLAAAISLSVEEEQGGRIGLHALSMAESWYRDVCGMTDLGFDEAKQMRYFEFTEAQAQQFIT